MRVIITNRFFTLKGGSTVKDEEGKDVLKVKGKMFSPTKKKFVCDMQGKRLFTVRNKWWRLWGRRCFVIDAAGHKVANVYHPPFAIKKFIVQGAEDEIMIDGQFFSFDYSIVRNGEPVAKISRKFGGREFMLGTDKFALEAKEEDIPFMVALVIALDNIRDAMAKSNK